MANLVLKISREQTEIAEAKYFFKDIDAFSDKYAVDKVDLIVDVEAVKAAIRNIFTWSIGEEILYPGFGNGLKKFLFEPLTEVSKTQIATEVKRCIEDNEPRVVIDSLAIDKSENDELHSELHLYLNYHIIGNKYGGMKIADTLTITDNGVKGKQ